MHLNAFCCCDFSKRVPPKTKISLNILGWFVLIVVFCQVYDEKDYRRARFVGRQKEVSFGGDSSNLYESVPSSVTQVTLFVLR